MKKLIFFILMFLFAFQVNAFEGDPFRVDTDNDGDVTASLHLGTAGVKLTGEDGGITLLGKGDGYDEDITFNLDDVENTIGASSSTGVTLIDFGTIDLSTDTLTLTGTGTINGLDAIDATGVTYLKTILQPLDATLSSISLLGTAADKGLYTTGIDTWAEFSLTAAGRAILDGATSAEMASLISDETGSGKVVFDTSPTLVTPEIGIATGTKITLTDTVSNDNSEIQVSNVLNPTSTINATSYHTGFQAKVRPIINTDVTQSGYAIGNWFQTFRNNNGADADDGGTLALLEGQYVLYGHNNTNSSAVPLTTEVYGLYLQPYLRTGTIGTLYDLYIHAGTLGGTATTRYSIYQASTVATNYFAGPVTMANTAINMTTSGTTLTVGVGADNGTVSAGIFSDRTKGYEGDALSEILKIKTKDGQIDHETLPEFVRTQQELPVYEEIVLTELSPNKIMARDIGVSVYKDDGDPEDTKDDKFYQMMNDGEIFNDGVQVIQRKQTGTRIEEQRIVNREVTMHDVAIQQLYQIIQDQAKQIEELQAIVMGK